jgi:glucose-1-phosphate cytidylyltransferase
MRVKLPVVKVVILCGGMGSRIRDASETLPKPMLPIGGKPIVWHIMKLYAHHGFKEFVLCLGYRAWMIKEFFLNYAAMTNDVVVQLGRERSVSVTGSDMEEDWNVILAETGELTQTGGRVAAVRKYLGEDDLFLLTYGDGVANVDIKALVEYHRSHGKIATVTAVRPPGRFGELGIDGDLVGEFNEKPQASGGFINGGFFVLDARRVWNFINDGPLERETMQRMAAESELAAFRHPGFWQPMDTLREYNLLNELWDAGNAPWKVW